MRAGMELNADFSLRAAVHAARSPWLPSPMAGVERRLLDRIGGEVARATSIVRYAAGSRFSPHVHGGGEEFLVLDGLFQDEHGDFPAGTYVRNPPTSRHTPGSPAGCTLFVKLWQFDPADRKEVTVNTAGMAYESVADRSGVAVLRLFRDDHEDVRLERWMPDSAIALDAPGGAELLVLDGAFDQDGERFEFLSWLRLPPGSFLRATAGASGCRLWIKTGHLLNIERSAFVARGSARKSSWMAVAPNSEAHREGRIQMVDTGEPVPYMARTRQYYRALGYVKDYVWARHDDVPFSKLRKPLAECRLALITTASPVDHSGTKQLWSAPVEPAPATLHTADLAWDKESTHTDDRGSFLPIEIAAKLANDGMFAGLTSRFYGVPTDYSQRNTNEIVAPGVLRRLRDDGADGAILCPL